MRLCELPPPDVQVNCPCRLGRAKLLKGGEKKVPKSKLCEDGPFLGTKN